MEESNVLPVSKATREEKWVDLIHSWRLMAEAKGDIQCLKYMTEVD